jgi:hypothetical protein
VNLYWAYHGTEFKPLGRHASWDDAAHYADGALPGWHSVVSIDELRTLHTQIGLQLGQRIPSDQLGQHAEAYLDTLQRLGPQDPEYWPARRRTTSAKARLEAFIRQFAKGN